MGGNYHEVWKGEVSMWPKVRPLLGRSKSHMWHVQIMVTPQWRKQVRKENLATLQRRDRLELVVDAYRGNDV